MQIALAVLAVLIVLAVWFMASSGPLRDDELERLSFERRIRAIAADYDFSYFARPPVGFDFRTFKGMMNAQGQFVTLDEPVVTFPALAAALLKGKKHEWMLFAYVEKDRVTALWMNKGPDSAQVTALISTGHLLAVAGGLAATDVLQFHNHPNPNPRLYSMALPSAQDKMTADALGGALASRNIAFHAFVTERGVHHQYASWIPDRYRPLDPFRAELTAVNGRSRFTNLQLRHEMGRPNRLAVMQRRPNSSTNLWSSSNGGGRTEAATASAHKVTPT